MICFARFFVSSFFIFFFLFEPLLISFVSLHVLLPFLLPFLPLSFVSLHVLLPFLLPLLPLFLSLSRTGLAKPFVPIPPQTRKRGREGGGV